MTNFSCFISMVTVGCMLAFLSISANALPAEPDAQGKISGTGMIGGHIGFENRKLTAGLTGGGSLRGFIAGIMNLGRDFLEMIRGRRGLDSTEDSEGMSGAGGLRSMSGRAGLGSVSGTGGSGSVTGSGGLESISGTGEQGSSIGSESGSGGLSSFESINSGSSKNIKQFSSSNTGSASYFRSVNGGDMEKTNGFDASSISSRGTIGGSSNIASRGVGLERSSLLGVEGRDGMQFANGADIDGGMNKIANLNSPTLDSGALDGSAAMRISSKRKVHVNHITRMRTNTLVDENEADETK